MRVLWACGEMREKKKGRRSNRDRWWWNDEMWKLLSRKKDAQKAMCQNSAEENKRKYNSMKNKAEISISKAMREKPEEAITELKNSPNRMFRLVIGSKTDCKEVEGARCMRGSDGKLCFSEEGRGNVWKDYMERITNEEND